MNVDALVERTLRKSGRLVIAEAEGQLWASDAYWMAPVPDLEHPIARLLNDYNLGLESGSYTFDKTLKLTSNKAPDMAKLIEQVRAKRLTVEPVRFGVEQAFIPRTMGEKGAMAGVFERSDGRRVVANRDFLELLKVLTPSDGRWEQVERSKTMSDPDLSPLVWVVKKKIHAMLMPIRVHGVNSMQQKVAA